MADIYIVDADAVAFDLVFDIRFQSTLSISMSL